MFSHANLAIFTKSGTLLPLNLKCDTMIAVNDDYDGQAIFYPVTAETEDGSAGVYIKGYKKIYGGRFLEETPTRTVAIISGKNIDYKSCNVSYERINTNAETSALYTITEISGIYGFDNNVITDSRITFPNISFSQKLIFDKVSTELFETEFLYVMGEHYNAQTGMMEYKKISEMAEENAEVREWAERYKLLFFIDCREQSDFRIFTVLGDEAIWSDRATLDLLYNTVNIGTDEEITLTEGEGSPRIDIGFSGEMEGTYRQGIHICLLDQLNIDEHDVPKIIPIGEIELIAEAEGEDERYRTLFTNFGIPDPKKFDNVYKESYVDDDKPDFISINRHSKEMFLEYDKIFPYVGTYKALINAVHLLGYDDIFFKEWYKVLNVSDEIPRGYVAYDMSYKNSGSNSTLSALPIEKRIHLRKKNWLSMMYSLNRELYGAPDEYDFPYVEELYNYRTEDALLKLIYLREWLEKYVLALNCRIIDIGGEGIFFERYALNGYGGISMNLEHEAGINIIPAISDSSLADTTVLIDSSAFITVKAVAGTENKTWDELGNLRFEDFCDGVISEDNIYHTYDGSINGRYIGTTFAGYNGRFVGKINAVSTVSNFIIGADNYISEDSPRLMIMNNEISFIPEDIVYKEKNTAFLRMPVIALERAVLRSFTDTWEKPIKYLVYPENDLDTGVSYFIENKISREKAGSSDYIFLMPPTYSETDDETNIIPRNGAEDSSVTHQKRKHYNFTSDFDASNNVTREYTTNDTTYGFRFSANNAYEIPLISIQGYSLKRPVDFELPLNEYYLDIIKGKLIFDDFERGRKIYIIFDTTESGERTITVKLSYFAPEFEICKYTDANNYTFSHFIEGNDYESFLERYDNDTDSAVSFDIFKFIKVYNSGEFKINLSVRDVYGEVYSADAYNTAKVLTLQPLITAYNNEPYSNNEYSREGCAEDASLLQDSYDKFCYFRYKTKYPVISAGTNETANEITYPIYPYSGDMPDREMIAHYANLSDKFKVVAYDKFIEHPDRIDWNFYLILNRQNRHKNTRIVEKNDKGALNELYSGDIHTGIDNMAHTCYQLFMDADTYHSENLDVTVMFYNEVGAFPVIQLPGKMLSAKALDNLQAGTVFQGNQNNIYGYYDDEYHLLLSHDITNCYIYTPSDNISRITSITDSSGNIYTGLSFYQDGVEWLVKSLFSEGYGSIWEYDFIMTRVTSEDEIMGKMYAYANVDPENVDASEGYYITPSEQIPIEETGTEWIPEEFENLPWISGWLTYKRNPILTRTFIDQDTQEEYETEYQVPAGWFDDIDNPDASLLRYRVPSFDAAFEENAVFSPYYAIKPKTIMDTIPDLLDDPNISVYIYPYWRSEVRIVGVSENRVYVQFENSKYKFPRAFKQGELVKLIWQTRNMNTLDPSNCIIQSSYKVVGYDELGFVLILEGEICGSYTVNPSKKYAYADLDNTSGRYAITKDGWDPKEYEDMPIVDGKDGWITGWLTLDGSSFFRHEYIPEESYYKDHPELYRDGSVGTRHTHVFRIPAGMYVSPDEDEDTPLIRYRVYSHNDLTCPYANPDNPDKGIDENGMFSPYYYMFDSSTDASLYISYAYNAYSDYKMPVVESEAKVTKASVSHQKSVHNDKLTYFIDDTFKATYRDFDKDNGILYWMNSEGNKPLICLNDIYSYNCPVTVYEKIPYTAFNIDYKDFPDDNMHTILWKVYKSIDATKKELLFESWNRSLFLDIAKKGIYDIEVNDFDKYGNKATHIYEGAYRILRSELDSVRVYDISVNTELVEGEGDFGYVTGGGTYEEGTMCILKAVAYDGFEFVGWSIDGTNIDTSDMLMFTVSNSCIITALFKARRYHIHVASNDISKGDVSINPVGTFNDEIDAEFLYGEECILKAIPKMYPDYENISYVFVKWQEDDIDITTEAKHIFNVTKDASFIAVFTDRTFTINTRSNNVEYGTARSTKLMCLPGEDCSFIATVTDENNYEFTGWFDNGLMLSDSSIYYVSRVLQNYDLTARFKVKDASYCNVLVQYSPHLAQNDYDITINEVPTTSSTGLYGSIFAIKCIPNENEAPRYTFNGWYQGNTLLGSDMSLNYTLILPNSTITARFNLVKYNVRCVIESEYGSVTPIESEVTINGNAVFMVTCKTIYQMSTAAPSATGSYGSITVGRIPDADPYKYIVTVNDVRSDITVTLDMFTIRGEYCPFYIRAVSGNCKVGLEHRVIAGEPLAFKCMIGNGPTIYDLTDSTYIQVPWGELLYIWTENIKNILFDGINTSKLFKVEVPNENLHSEVRYVAGGNIMSLLIPRTMGNTYVNYNDRPLTDANKDCFGYLFNESELEAADKIILPKNVKPGCYRNMLSNTHITESPVLRSHNIDADCYYELFANCSELKKVTTLQEQWYENSILHGSRPTYATNRWLLNVPISGEFRKLPVLDALTDISNAIPPQWDIEIIYEPQ